MPDRNRFHFVRSAAAAAAEATRRKKYVWEKNNTRKNKKNNVFINFFLCPTPVCTYT